MSCVQPALPVFHTNWGMLAEPAANIKARLTEHQTPSFGMFSLINRHEPLQNPKAVYPALLKPRPQTMTY